MSKFIQHVVYTHRDKLRWYFISTENKKIYFISLNIKDIKYLFNGIHLLVPPFSIKHLTGILE